MFLAEFLRCRERFGSSRARAPVYFLTKLLRCREQFGSPWPRGLVPRGLVDPSEVLRWARAPVDMSELQDS